MTSEERDELIWDMADRHGGYTCSFWWEWDERYANNTAGFRDATDKTYNENPEAIDIHKNLPSDLEV